MSDFGMRSFCRHCGRFRLTMPFGDDSNFFDSNNGPCRHCGTPGPGRRVIAKSMNFGFLWLRRMWVDREGHRVDLPEELVA